jgi:hypothetical protein
MPESPTSSEALAQAGDLLDVESLRQRVDVVLGEEMYWFPVRHHSPAVARLLEAAIQERKPRVIFLEGPSAANELIPYLVDGKTRPPVAIYSSYRDDDNVLGLAGIASPAPDIPARFAVWYPLMAYSPEYLALTTAARLKINVVFIDLPHHALLKPVAKEAATEEKPAPPPAPVTPEAADDQLLAESGFYQRLAQVAGYRSWNEAWDSLFEMRDLADVEEFRREMATFCAAARATTPSARLLHDDTLPRERCMLQTIRTLLRERKIPAKEAMIVCGGFHLFLDRNDPEPPPAPPRGTVYSTVVPYSFFRFSELSGYGAGNRAPRFYQRSWDLRRSDRDSDLVPEHAIDVLKQLRKAGDNASSADAIAVCQHARLLARLRGRPRPVLDDLHDALVTCVCKGDPDQDDHLKAAIDHADIGITIGKVTPALGRLPMVEDFHRQLEQLELTEVTDKEKRVALTLDKREPLAARRSAFLHRLTFLEIGLATLTEAPPVDLATGKIFREKWALRWSPNVEAKLAEQNLYGDTLEAAALAKLEEELAREEQHAGKTCVRLVQAIDMDLPNFVQRAREACGKAIDNDPRFTSLSQALAQLCLLERYAQFRNLRRDELDELLVRCYDRTCFALPDAASAPPEQQDEVVGGLQSVAEVVGRQAGFDRGLFVQHVRQSAHTSTVPFLRGAFLGMLTELRDIPAEELAREIVALARGPVDVQIQAGDFLDGVLAVSRTSIMIGADALIAAVDELLRSAEWEPFLTMLPRLRAAFQRLSNHHVGSLANKVAELYGLKKAEMLTELTTSLGAAAWIARIDQQVAKIMAAWE